MKFTVGMKIALMNGVAILALVLIGAANYYTTDKMLTSIDWRQHSYLVKYNLSVLLSRLVDLETGERGYLLTKEKTFLEPYNTALAKIPNLLNDLRSLTQDNIDQQQSLATLEQLIASKERSIQLVGQTTSQAQLIAELTDGKEIMDKIRWVITNMNDKEDQILSTRIEDATSSINEVFLSIVYGTGLAVIFLIVVGVGLTLNIAKPLREITNAAKKIATGDLDELIAPLERQDEVGDLSQTFNRMSQSLRSIAQSASTVSSGDLTVNIKPQSEKDILGHSLAKMIDNLRQFALDNNDMVKLLNTAVNEILGSSSRFVESGSGTATAVSEATSVIEEIRQTAQIATQKSKAVSDDAQLAVQISEHGRNGIAESNEGMTRIRDQMVSVAESMMMLSEQTQRITSIVETVDDLSQQSNLLSVNASIEAEKAGEQGKGFRIVAQEIRSLADQSKQATHKVREILSDIQKATSTAVLATEQGNKFAQNSLKKLEETGAAIEKLANSVMEGAQTAIQIAASSQQQLIGMDQAATAMANIKEASIQNVEGAKQLSVAAHNLKEISVKLEKLVKEYKVKN